MRDKVGDKVNSQIVRCRQHNMETEQSNSWMSELSGEGLLRLVEQNPQLAENLNEGTPIDVLGYVCLPPSIDGEVQYFVHPRYWYQLKEEFRLLICTQDKKYDALRKQLTTTEDKSQIGIVSTIAAAMARQFGVVADVVVPFCALCLIAVVRLGKEPFFNARCIDE